MQCGLGIGFFLASLVWLFVGAMGPDAWRIMFLLGILPALLTLWIRVGIPESALWEATSIEQRHAALDRAEERRGARRAGAGADPLHRRRPVRRPAAPAASPSWCS